MRQDLRHDVPVTLVKYAPKGRLSNPTIIIIVDREDLDDQSSELFVAAKRFLHDDDVRSIESRADLEETLKDKPSGGVYITTIQKFTETLGFFQIEATSSAFR